MTTENIDDILSCQREYFASGATLPLDARKKALMSLRDSVKAHEDDIAEAVRADLGKSEFETYMCETGLVLSEIGYMLKHTAAFMKPRKVRTPMSQFPSKSLRIPTPRGNTLIMSPWNYPVLLTLEPLVSAIAAGNTAVIKPSAYSPATSGLLKLIVSEAFRPGHAAVVTGGRRENAALLDKKFDFVFFTGSTNVGREVLRHTAETLTPAVLELGGKSPCIVDDTADLKLAARRIVFGKFLNGGQTCVAPDYVLCDSLAQATENIYFIYDYENDRLYFSENIQKAGDLFPFGQKYCKLEEWQNRMETCDAQHLTQLISDLVSHKSERIEFNYRLCNAQNEYVWINTRGKGCYRADRSLCCIIGQLSVSRDERQQETYNHKELKCEIREILKNVNPCYLLLIGVDNLKAINLTNGRDFGDTVLNDIARIIGEETGQRFRVYRINGDWFGSPLSKK